MRTKLRLVLSITIFFLGFYGWSQATFWKPEPDMEPGRNASLSILKNDENAAYQLDEKGIAVRLRELVGATDRTTLYFPDEKGKLLPFSVQETPVFSKELQGRYPQIRSYTGYGIQGNVSRIRFSLSPNGFQGMIVSGTGKRTLFLERVPDRKEMYIVYSRDGVLEAPVSLVCKTETRIGAKGSAATTARLVDDQQLRTYRLAVAASGEYTEYHGGTVIDALAAINATLTRVNEVFERDLSIRMELIGATDQVIYTDAVTDPFGGNLSSEVQTTLTNVIGESAYDIGHLFHQGSASGNAGFIGAVCVDNQKGSAFSSVPDPVGDIFDLDYVSHEMGHQFGANHTWSFESEGTLVQAEPGSGTTIMGYAGIAEQNNVAPNGDDYFHYYSLLQISQYVQSISCGNLTPISNNPPIVAPLLNYTIPSGTAFRLEGTASDSDVGDVLTYIWEQIDDGVVTTDNFGPDLPGGAQFRSRPPTTDSFRYFPLLSRILSGNLTETNPDINSDWETVSNVERDLNFAFTVRDNAVGGGQVDAELTKVSVIKNAGPFRVSSQATPVSYPGGSIQTVSWDVANTNLAPLNTQEVDIYLSTDGGLTFPVQLADNVPNSGSFEVQFPATGTTRARVMVKAADNIYFAINASDFEITEASFALLLDATEYSVCAPANLNIPLNFETYAGFTGTVNLSVSDAPAGLNTAFSQNDLTATTALSLALTNTAAVSAGAYDLNINVDNGASVLALPIRLLIASDLDPPTLFFPADNATDISLSPVLRWQEIPENSGYRLEIATDPGFSTIIADVVTTDNEYNPGILDESTTYFWRVGSVNSCGTGIYGTPNQFTTITVSCTTRSAGNLPLIIPANGTHILTREIVITDNLTVADVDVTLDIEHSFLADLVVSLTSPSGTRVVLLSNSCGDGNDVNAVFDQSAPPFLCGGTPTIEGVVRPLGSLNSFIGESSSGTWVLTIEDTVSADGGQLNVFDLNLCLEGVLRPDADADGVFDDGDDLCLGTPAGAEVDVNGCEVFRFPVNNFEIEVQSLSCRGTNDGTITLSTEFKLDYTAFLNGSGINRTEVFDTSLIFDNLPPGSYDLCIEGTDGTNNYEPICFTIQVKEPEPLDVDAELILDGRVLRLQLRGSDLYIIELNGERTTTTSSVIDLDLKQGANQLRVIGALPCQGSYEGIYFTSQEIAASPNPFRDLVELFVPFSDRTVRISVFTSAGSFIASAVYPVTDQKVQLNLAQLTPGVYLLQVEGKDGLKSTKLIKQ